MSMPETWLMYPRTEKMTQPPMMEAKGMRQATTIESFMKSRLYLLYEPRAIRPPKEQLKE